MKEKLEMLKTRLEQARIFNAASPLPIFEIQKYYQNESKPNGVYSKNDLLRIKHGADVINLNEFKSIGTHWIASYENINNVIYFNRFAHIPKQIIKLIKKQKCHNKYI